MTGRHKGFTLIELIVVMVVTGILAGVLVVFFRPAISSYMDVVNRAELTDQADIAMRTMLRDIRLAVPNSFRSPHPNCFEVIPTSTGGRYRADVDTVNAGSLAVDHSTAIQSFDVLTNFRTLPSQDDWIVAATENTSDVYTANVNKAQIDSILTPVPPSPLYKHRVQLKTPLQFPEGYGGSRFVVVPDNQKAVFYACANVGTTNGNGTGILYRYSNYGFNQNAFNNCAPGLPTPPIVARGISSCQITLNPNPGAIQGAGYVEVRLGFTANNETVNLTFGAHTDNLP